MRSTRKARFSSYYFDLDSGIITRFGTRIRLGTQPAKLLCLLIEANGTMVSRRELILALWPGETQGDFEARLDKAMAKLRSALNDDPAKPQFIETIKGRGYRFVKEVTIEGLQLPLQPGQIISEPAFSKVNPREASSDVRLELHALDSAVSVSQSPISKLAWRIVIGILLVLGTIASGVWLKFRPNRSLNRQRVVLMLEIPERSGIPEDSWISHAIEEWLSTDLESGGELHIVRIGDNLHLGAQKVDNSCGQLPDSQLEIARRAFNADAVIYGDFVDPIGQAAGERLRVSICLDETKGGLRSAPIVLVGDKGEIAELATNASELLRSRIGLAELSPQSLGYLRAAFPKDLSAARFYAEGASALERFDPKQASVLLTEAARIEPEHAPTHAALSLAWRALGYEEQSNHEALLARSLAKGLAPMQQLEYQGLADEAQADWNGAIDSYLKLLQARPDSIEYTLKLANSQIQAGEVQEAIRGLQSFRRRSDIASFDPRVNLAEAAAYAKLSDFKSEGAAASKAQMQAEAQGSELLIADARMQEGDAKDSLDDWAAAEVLWQSAGEIYQSIGNRGGLIDSMNRRALLAWHRADTADAIRLFERAINLSKDIGDDGGVAYSLSRLGDLNLYAGPKIGGNADAAISMFRQADAIYKKLGNRAEEANIVSLFGDEAMRRTSYQEAKIYYSKAMSLSQLASDKSRVANRLLDLGIVTEALGEPEGAKRFFQQSEVAYERLGQKDRAAIAKGGIAFVLLREGQISEAEPLYMSSIADLQSIGRKLQVIQAREQLVMLELDRDPAKAESLAKQNLEDSKSDSAMNPLAITLCYAYLARAESQLGKVHEAEESISRAFAQVHNEIPSAFLPEVLTARAYVRMSARQYRTAETDLRRSQSLAHAQKHLYWELEARLGLAELHSVQRRKLARSELVVLKQSAKDAGYGLICLKIDQFVSSHPGSSETSRIIWDSADRTPGIS